MALTKVPSNLDATIATTQSASDNSTNVATTAYVTTAVSNLVDGAPAALNTLNEIAAALNDDAALNTTLTNSIATKLPLAGGNLTGNLGIGASSPSFPLHINSSSTDVAKFQTSGSYAYTRFQNSSKTWALSVGSDFGFYDEAASATRMLIDSSGKVGIAEGGVIYASRFSVGKPHTHAPGSAFTNSPSSFYSEVQLGGTTGNDQKLVTFAGTDGSNVSGLALYRYRRATGTNWTTDGFSLRQEVDNTENIYNYINFTAGKVGIGTSSPDSKLHVHGVGALLSSDSYFVAQIQTDRNDDGSNDDGILQFVNGSSKTVKGEIRFDESTNTFELGHGDNQNHLVIASGGNVGIGTDNPGEKLEVDGIIQIKRTGDHPAIRFMEDGNTRAYMGSGDWAINGGNVDDFGISASGTGDLIFGTTAGVERMRIHANGHVSLGAVTDLAFVRPVYRKNITVNKTFTKLFNTGGAQLASGFVLNIHGTGTGVVVNAKFDVLVNHYQDISISALGTFYTLCKIKVVTNGNEDATVYAAINSNNASSLTIEVEPLHNTTLEFNPSTAYSTNYYIHEASGGHTTGSAASMASGAGTTTGYS